ncbi:MAG: hypothetical protein H0V04_08880 [Chloroflexi bacterium]|nr:hypothetical protein [Chloroflexota bacterium]
MSHETAAIDHEVALAWAERVAEQWTLDASGRDTLVVEGLPMRWPLRVEVFNVLRRLAIAQLGGSDPSGSGTTLMLKRFGLDRAARAAGVRLARLPSAEPARGGADRPVVFISEMATPSTLDQLLLVARHLPAALVVPLVADPRAASPWRSAGHTPVSAKLAWPDERRMLRKMGVHVADAWRDARTSLAPPRLQDHDVRAPFLRAVAPLVTRSGPWLWAERAALEIAFERLRPRIVVMASDQHRIGWLASRVAGQMAIPSVVLQHGLPQGRTGYVPVVADHVAVWSEASREWFLGEGTPAARLVVTGSPRLDGLVRVARARERASERGRGGRPQVLLALSPGATEPNERVLRLVLDASKDLPQARLVVKLHPGSGDWRFVRREVARLDDGVRSRVRIAHREPLAPLLSWADVTVVLRTTVALESLVAGTPVVAADVGVPSIADLELRDLDLDRAGTATDLAALVRRLADPDERRAWLEIRRDRIERLAGPADGRAAERIAQLLLGAAPG